MLSNNIYYHIKKIKETVERFSEKELYKRYKCLIILLINTNQKIKYRQEKIVLNDYEFNIQENTINLNDIFKDVCKNNKVNEVLEYLESEFQIMKKIDNSEKKEFFKFPMLNIINRRLRISEIEFDNNDSLRRLHNSNSYSFVENYNNSICEFEIKLVNCGELPIHKIAIGRVCVYYDIGEAEYEEYSLAPVVEYECFKEQEVVLYPDNTHIISILFEDVFEGDMYDEIEINFDIKAYCYYGNNLEVKKIKMMCTMEDESSDSICGEYNVQAIEQRLIL